MNITIGGIWEHFQEKGIDTTEIDNNKLERLGNTHNISIELVGSEVVIKIGKQYEPGRKLFGVPKMVCVDGRTTFKFDMSNPKSFDEIDDKVVKLWETLESQQ